FNDNTGLGLSSYTGLGSPSSIDGQALDANSLVVRFTWQGDGNLDGFKWGDPTPSASSTHYWTGDYNYSGQFDADDSFLSDLPGGQPIWPKFSVSATSVQDGNSFTVTVLNPVTPLRVRTITSWTIVWGDGNTSTVLPGNPSASYSYNDASGSHDVRVTAT